MTARQDEVNEKAIRAAIAAMPREFSTKDISEHPTVRAAHGSDTTDDRYHQVIGSYLGANRGYLGLTSVGRGGRGERWRKQGAPVTGWTFPDHVTQRIDAIMAQFQTGE